MNDRLPAVAKNLLKRHPEVWMLVAVALAAVVAANLRVAFDSPSAAAVWIGLSMAGAAGIAVLIRVIRGILSVSAVALGLWALGLVVVAVASVFALVTAESAPPSMTEAAEAPSRREQAVDEKPVSEDRVAGKPKPLESQKAATETGEKEVSASTLSPVAASTDPKDEELQALAFVTRVYSMKKPIRDSLAGYRDCKLHEATGSWSPWKKGAAPAGVSEWIGCDGHAAPTVEDSTVTSDFDEVDGYWDNRGSCTYTFKCQSCAPGFSLADNKCGR